MTVVIAFHCSDGVVIAADSMITPSMGGLSVGHHHGQKISILPGPQIFALAGDTGQNARIRIVAETNHEVIANTAHPIDFPLQLTQTMIQQFTVTGINNAINANPVLAYVHGDQHQCCVFEGALQPRLLDEHHYYSAHGSGKLSADPFLRFLTDVFCPAGRPTVREAIFLAAWTVQHVIDVNPGGVAGPVRIATLERDGAGVLTARSLPTEEIDEHLQAIESAATALRKWRDEIQSGHAADDAPEPPTPPPSAAAAEPPNAAPVSTARAKAGEVQLRFTIRKQADDLFRVWDNVADELPKFGGMSFVGLEYEKAWSEADRLNKHVC